MRTTSTERLVETTGTIVCVSSRTQSLTVKLSSETVIDGPVTVH